MDPEITTETSSTYVRTYAKDYAATAGKPLDATPIAERARKPKTTKPAKSPKEPKAPKPAKVKKEKPIQEKRSWFTKKESVTRPEEDGVITEEVTAQEQANAEVITRKGEREVLELPKIDQGIMEDRAAILARLKAQVETQQPDVPPVTIAPVIPPPPIPIPAPLVFVPPVPAAPVAPTAEPSPLHTYKSDFSDHIDETHASTFSVLAAQKDAKPKKSKRVKEKRARTGGAVFAVLGGLLLLAVGAGGIFAAYLYINRQVINPITSAPYLITPNSEVKLTGTGPQLMEALADQANQPLTTGSVVLTYVDESTTTPQGVTEEPASGGALITELQLSAPDVLLRNIDPSSMVGIIQAGTQTRPFFILKVLSYERTFAGMLQWEPSLASNLSALYPLYPDAAPSASSTDTSIGQNQPSDSFVDEIVSNHSVRALKDISGRTIVLYGYADTQTLIIARDESAFTSILEKLQPSSS